MAKPQSKIGHNGRLYYERDELLAYVTRLQNEASSKSENPCFEIALAADGSWIHKIDGKVVAREHPGVPESSGGESVDYESAVQSVPRKKIGGPKKVSAQKDVLENGFNYWKSHGQPGSGKLGALRLQWASNNHVAVFVNDIMIDSEARGVAFPEYNPKPLQCKCFPDCKIQTIGTGCAEPGQTKENYASYLDFLPSVDYGSGYTNVVLKLYEFSRGLLLKGRPLNRQRLLCKLRKFYTERMKQVYPVDTPSCLPACVDAWIKHSLSIKY